MKKLASFIKNIYRLRIYKPGSNPRSMKISQYDKSNKGNADRILKNALQYDSSMPDLEPELQHMLEQRVARKTKGTIISSNSFAGLLQPLFLFRNSIEIKMAAITLGLIMFMRIGPVVNHNINRNIQPSFLADTLIDSSSRSIMFLDASDITR